MFKTMDQELPPMPTEMLKLRSELWEADGMHLIYNVPRQGTGVERTGPMRPFAGLCIAFLMYLPKDNTKFCQQLGKGDKAYTVGWTPDASRGMYSLTRINGQWKGKMDKSKKKFPKGYVYVYFYFENHNTLHGWINDTHDLQAKDTHPYPVSDVGNKITLGVSSFNDAKTLEIHWVLWGSSHNRNGAPSAENVPKLFPRTSDDVVAFREYDIFEMRAGTRITIRTKFTQGPDPKKSGVSVFIGCPRCKVKKPQGFTFLGYNDPRKEYTIRMTITEKGAIVHYEDGVAYKHLDYCESAEVNCRAFISLESQKPLHVQVETMGQEW